MTTMRETRTEKRALFDPTQRIVLLEQDSDQFEDTAHQINKQLSKLLWLAFGSLITFATATVFFAIDVLAGGVTP